LLVIDNCERVLGGVALMVQELLETTPGVNVLATSREALGIPGEQVFPLAPLSTVSGRAAGELFIERARAAQPDLSLSVDDRTAIEAICERLDGLPLAIELAATRRRCLRRGTHARGRRTLQRLRTVNWYETARCGPIATTPPPGPWWPTAGSPIVGGRTTRCTR
jgi:predicted ATPase